MEHLIIWAECIRLESQGRITNCVYHINLNNKPFNTYNQVWEGQQSHEADLQSHKNHTLVSSQEQRSSGVVTMFEFLRGAGDTH